MTNPKRYHPRLEEDGLAMLEEPAGEWVRYDDIKHLLQDKPPRIGTAGDLITRDHGLPGKSGRGTMARADEPEKQPVTKQNVDPGIPVAVTLRNAEDANGYEETHLECRFRDGQKYAAVTIEPECSELAALIVRAIEQHNDRGKTFVTDEPTAPPHVCIFVDKGALAQAQIDLLSTRGISVVEQEPTEACKYEVYRHITTVGGIESFGGTRGHVDTSVHLARCPFCGSQAGFHDSGRLDTKFNRWVECSNTSCGVRTPEHYQTREAAAEAWNRRDRNAAPEKKAEPKPDHECEPMEMDGDTCLICGSPMNRNGDV